MEDKTKFFIGAFVILGVVVTLTFILDLYSIWTLFGMIFYSIVFFSFYIFILYEENRINFENKQREEKKQTFKWCWNKTNEILRKMPGGQGISWEGGFGKRSEIKHFSDGKIQHPFRYIFGTLESGQPILIVFDIDREDIARYYANPTPKLIDDPFYKFNPFSRGLNDNFYDKYPHRFGDKRFGNSNVPYPDFNQQGREASYSDLPVSPSSNDVNQAVEKLKNDGTKRD